MTNVANRIADLSPDQLEKLMKRLAHTRGTSVRSRIPRQARDTNTFPLSFTQQRQWFMEQLAPDAVYNMPQALRLIGQVDVGVLERAFSMILQRHDALRTTFQVVDGQPVQVVGEGASWTLPIIDLRDRPADEYEAELRRQMDSEARFHFDIVHGPLWRMLLIRLTDTEQILIVTLHHIIADGWSMGVALRELTTLYAALTAGKPVDLPALPIQYVDFAVWQRQWLAESDASSTSSLQRQRAFWKQQLADAPALLELPTDRPRPPVQTFTGAIVTFALSPAQTAALRSLSEREGVTLFMTMLSAFQALLYRYAGQDDLCIGTPVANRTHPELEGLIGLFINTLVLRTSLAGNPTWCELVQRVRQVALDAFANQELPLEKLVEELHPERDLSYSPLFQVLFVHNEETATGVEIPGLSIDALPSHSGTAQFDLSLYLSESRDQLQGFFEYNTDLFDAMTIEQMAHHFVALLEQIVAHPDAVLDTLVADIPIQKLNIVISAAFTAEPLAESLHFWMLQQQIPAHIRFAPYSQVFQQLLDPTSLLATNAEGVNVIVLRLEDWAQKYTGPDAGLFQILEQNVRDFLDALVVSRTYHGAPCIVCVCPPSERITAHPERCDFLDRLDHMLRQQIATVPYVKLLHYRELITRYPITTIHDPRGDELGHIPYTPEFFAVLGTGIARSLVALHTPAYQALLVDCDHTLWAGRRNGEAASTPDSESAYRDLQSALINLRQAGIRLGICGKQDAGIVQTIMQHDSTMLLTPEHIAAWHIGQEPVAQRISAVASTLQVPLSACIYLSGNPAEYAEARAICPEVLTVALPDQPELYSDFLDHLWVLPQVSRGQ